MRRERDNRPWIIAGITMTLVGIALAIAIVQRMSDEAVAVLAGAVCGVGASIPTSLLIIAVSARSHSKPQPTYPTQGIAMPPIIVQQPPALPQGTYGQPTWSTRIDHTNAREFQVVGDDDY